MPSSPSSRREQILADHRQIRSILAGLQETDDRRQLASLLEQLIALLERHFTLEEAEGGIFDAVRESHLISHADRLADDHRALLMQARSALGHMSSDDDDAIANPAEEVKALVASLHEHEQRESEILSEAVSTDIGSGD